MEIFAALEKDTIEGIEIKNPELYANSHLSDLNELRSLRWLDGAKA